MVDNECKCSNTSIAILRTACCVTLENKNSLNSVNKEDANRNAPQPKIKAMGTINRRLGSSADNAKSSIKYFKTIGMPKFETLAKTKQDNANPTRHGYFKT